GFRRHRVARHQRLIDADMLADIDLDKVMQRIGEARVVDRAAYLFANEGYEGMDVAVAGCPCDLAMEEQIGIDAALLPALFAAHAVEGCLDRVEILLAAARGG